MDDRRARRPRPLARAGSWTIGLAVEVRVASSPLEAIEAFGGEADIGLLNLFEYLLAHEGYGAEAKLRVLRQGGAESYTGAIIVRSDSTISSIADLSGRRIAYVRVGATGVGVRGRSIDTATAEKGEDLRVAPGKLGGYADARVCEELRGEDEAAGGVGVQRRVTACETATAELVLSLCAGG